ncbi:MAG: hypothetical protein KC442_12340, partial [Thermomicrobiales bacterium]|nr:hypothetical protein [Thermomicrobiales bacterium]
TQTTSFLSSDAPSPIGGRNPFDGPPHASAIILDDTPERWARALDHALHAGVEILTTPAGERFASSGSHLDLIYRVTETTCECDRARLGDSVCSHRAALRFILDLLPVVVVPVDALPIPIHHGAACPCELCWRRT